MLVRQYHREDLPQLMQLYYDTIHHINSRHYTQKQVDTWAPLQPDRHSWEQRLAHNTCFVYETSGGIITGFAELKAACLLDMLYVHKDYQGQGMATELLYHVEAAAMSRGCTEITTEASITARPFFEKKGFIVVTEQNKLHGEVYFLNYLMKKFLVAE